MFELIRKGMWVAVLALLLPAGALAQGQGWSVQSARTVGAGNNVIHAQAGWPGFSAKFLHGAGSTLDLGGAFTFNYGYEGLFTSVRPGIKGQFLVRALLLESSSVLLGLHASPGLGVYFARGVALPGLAMPVGLELGIPASSALMASVGFDVPIYIDFGRAVIVPLLFGGGIEYFINTDIAVTGNIRIGPAIDLTDGDANLAMQMLIGAAFRL